MAESKYSLIYSRFHGAYTFKILEDKLIVIPLYSVSKMKLAYMKMKSLVKQIHHDCSDKPLVKAITDYLNIKDMATVCHDPEKSWCLLLGKQKLIYPQDNGDFLLAGTFYFVKRENLEGFRRFAVSTLGLVSCGSEVYKYNDGSILYLDCSDIPYPGGTYFNSYPGGGNWFRVCLITSNTIKNYSERFLNPFSKEKFLFQFNPSKTGYVETCLSPFLNLCAQKFSYNPDYTLSTSPINLTRRYEKPSFLFQDIIDTFGRSRAVGLLIETPIRFTFEPESITTIADNIEGGEDGDGYRKFYALAVNCSTPKVIVYVPKPYDRYYEIENDYKQNLNWTSVSYGGKRELYSLMEEIVFNGNLIGYSYKNTFFCLSDVKLVTLTLIEHQNLHLMFQKLSFDLKDDPEFIVLDTQNYNNFKIYKVKHVNFRQELHCISDISTEEERGEGNGNNSSPAKRYKKEMNLTPLVKNWINLIASSTSFYDKKRFVNMEVIKLIHVLIRHKICLQLKGKSEGDPEEIFVDNDVIVFYMDKAVKDFINKLRFEIMGKDSDDDNNSNNDSCLIT